MRAYVRISVALVVAIAGAACSGSVNAGTTPTLVATHSVAATDSLKFEPAGAQIAAGETITWTNQGSVPHTVTSDDASGLMKSSVLNKGDVYSVTFTTAGSYSYHCAIHPGMKGLIVVS